jgi:hypothetical protein
MPIQRERLLVTKTMQRFFIVHLQKKKFVSSFALDIEEKKGTMFRDYEFFFEKKILSLNSYIVL